MENLKDFLLNKKLKFSILAIIEFILCLIFISSIFNILYMKKVNDIWSLKDLLLGSTTGIISILIIIKSFIDNKNKLEKIFVTIGIPLLIAYMIFVIPFKVPDEDSHFYRSFNIARGDILISKEQNEESIPKEYQNLRDTITSYSTLFEAKANNIHSSTRDNEVKQFNAAQAYFPSIYIGPVIANIIGNIINLDVISLVYLMRIMNIIIYLVLGYYSIKFLPFGKLLMLAYLCIPMMLHQAASVSPDGFMNAMSMLFIAYSMKLLFKKDKDFTLKEKIFYFIVALLATLNKAAYMPLIFIATLFIFNKNHPRNKKDKVFMLVTIIIMVTLTGVWYLVGNKYTDTREIVAVKGANSPEQLAFVKSNPTYFLKLLFNCLYGNKTLFMQQALGSQLGYLDIHVDTFFTIFYLVLLLFAPFLEKSDFKLTNWQKIWLLAITVGVSSIICFAMYIGWSRPGLEFIDGVQGRYFLPVLILPLLCLIQKDNYLKFKHTTLVYSTLIIFINYFFLNAVFKFFI